MDMDPRDKARKMFGQGILGQKIMERERRMQDPTKPLEQKAKAKADALRRIDKASMLGY